MKKHFALVIFAGIAYLMPTLPVFAHREELSGTYFHNGMMNGMWGMMGYGQTGIIWITLILTWVLMFLAIIALIKWINKNK